MNERLGFVQVAVFAKRLDEVNSADEVLLAIEEDLLENPLRGKIIKGTGGLRKARVADPDRSKGKRGGIRYLYYYFDDDGTIYLCFMFRKDEQDNLTPDQTKLLRDIIKGIVAERKDEKP
jgi:hypothetical protein